MQVCKLAGDPVTLLNLSQTETCHMTVNGNSFITDMQHDSALKKHFKLQACSSFSLMKLWLKQKLIKMNIKSIINTRWVYICIEKYVILLPLIHADWLIDARLKIK